MEHQRLTFPTPPFWSFTISYHERYVARIWSVTIRMDEIKRKNGELYKFIYIIGVKKTVVGSLTYEFSQAFPSIKRVTSETYIPLSRKLHSKAQLCFRGNNILS